MKLASISQISPATMLSSRYDAVFCASGFESRASYIAQALSKEGAEIGRRFALAFHDRQAGARKKNDKLLKELDYDLLPGSGNDADAISALLRPMLPSLGGRVPAILVDISSMTRAWYAGLLTFIRDSVQSLPGLEVTFAYVPGNFTEPPPQASPLKAIDFLPGFGGVEDPSMPSALILGLGYEKGRASAVLDMQDPEIAYAWIASPTVDSRYVEAVQSCNAGLLSQLPPDQIVHYPLRSLERTAVCLESLCVGLRQTHRVAIAPLGPKAFSLVSLLVANAVPGIGVWRATAGVSGDVVDREPAKDPVGLRVFFDNGDGA